jgi:uncharacterized protein
MIKVLEYIIRSIVDNPDDVKIEEQVLDNKSVYTINCNQADLPRIIGKHGKIIKAIRDIGKLAASKNNLYVDIMLNDGRTL